MVLGYAKNILWVMWNMIELKNIIISQIELILNYFDSIQVKFEVVWHIWRDFRFTKPKWRAIEKIILERV